MRPAARRPPRWPGSTCPCPVPMVPGETCWRGPWPTARWGRNCSTTRSSGCCGWPTRSARSTAPTGTSPTAPTGTSPTACTGTFPTALTGTFLPLPLPLPRRSWPIPRCCAGRPPSPSCCCGTPATCCRSTLARFAASPSSARTRCIRPSRAAAAPASSRPGSPRRPGHCGRRWPDGPTSGSPSAARPGSRCLSRPPGRCVIRSPGPMACGWSSGTTRTGCSPPSTAPRPAWPGGTASRPESAGDSRGG